MRDDDDGGAFVGEAPQGGRDGVQMPGVDARGRLVQDDDGSLGRSGCGNDEALLLSPGQAQGVAFGEVSQIEVRQEGFPGLAARPGSADREFPCQGVGEELAAGVLHDEGAGRPALPARGGTAVQADGSAARRREPAQRAHEGRLSGAVRSGDTGDLPGRKVCVEPLEHSIVAVGEAQVSAR